MAPPPPDRELERLQKALRTGLPPVVVVTGPGSFFRQEAMALLLAAVPDEAELRTVDGAGLQLRAGSDEEPAGDGDADGPGEALPSGGPAELQDLRGGGLFTRSSYLCVRRGDRWLRLHGEALVAVLPRIATGCGLILEVERLDKRTRAAKALAEAGQLFEFRDLYETPYQSDDPLQGELVRWVQQRGRALGVPLQPEAAWLLCTQVGRNPGELLAELERLRAQIPAAVRKRPLHVDDLRGLVSVLFESTQFELAEALLDGDRARALRSLRALFERGLKGRDGKSIDPGGVFPMVSNWIYQSLAGALIGRNLLDEGVPQRDLAARCGVRYFQERFVAQVVRNDAAALSRGILLLLECQRLLRLCGEEPELLLERFVQAWFGQRAELLPGATPW